MSSNHLFSYPITFYTIVSFFAGAFLLSCTFQEPQPEQLQVSLVSPLADTIETYPILTFAFSIPLRDSTVRFSLSPAPGQEAACFTSLNSTLDTARFIVGGMLQGSTSYQIYPADDIVAQNGTVFKQTSGSWTFSTYAREQEPNNKRETADTLFDTRCGSFEQSHDIDWFICADDSAECIIIDAKTGPCSVIAYDFERKIIHSTAPDSSNLLDIGLIDTLCVPDSITPFFLAVKPLFAGLATHYRIRIVK